MFELVGKYASAKVYVDKLEESAIAQLQALLNLAAFEGATIRIMPDAHAGAGCVIGFTCLMAKPIVVPNLIGVDINCGVLSYCILPNGELLLPSLDRVIRETVPSGFNAHKRIPLATRQYLDRNPRFVKQLKDTCSAIDYNYEKAIGSLGTLGGGNHFIELGKSPTTNHLWLTVHTGSRNFGLCVCKHYQQLAVKTHGKLGGLEWLEGTERDNYIRDMGTAQEFASANRNLILNSITDSTHLIKDGGVSVTGFVESVHNYMDTTIGNGLIRKGAISAKEGEAVIIPWNMKDGLVIGIGKGNTDWNNSAPHGAGRALARNVAKKTLDIQKYKEAMKGVYSTCVTKATIDESPQAYKDPKIIEAQLTDTIEVLDRVPSIYNFKAE